MSDKVEFTADRLEKFHRLVAKYEQPASALLPTLYLAQEQFGFLSPAVLEYVAGILKIPPAAAFEAASFYLLFKQKDMGQWCLQICNNVTCTMMGSEELIQVAKEELGIGFHEVTPDRKFSVVPVQCLGSCGTAPVVQVNEDYHENLSAVKFRDLLKRLRQSNATSSREQEAEV